MKVEIKLTGDGSHTLYVPGLNEHYHSVYGAMAESEHVFINAGLKAAKSNQINILEVGMGTGLNVLLTFLHAQQHAIKINYLAYEPFPLARETLEKLNFCNLPGFEGLTEVFSMIHNSKFNTQTELTENFAFQKVKEKIEDANIPASIFHLVYFDAFAPGVQPEMWDQRIFRKLFKACRNDGILVTYSAKGEVRRNLIEVGFNVEKLPGPPGKRVMLRARKGTDKS